MFAARLRKARLAAGLTKAAMCGAIGFAGRSAATKWEKGEGMPDVAVLPRLAVALGTTVDYLLGVDLLREAAPAPTIDLDAVVGGTAPILWSGQPLTQEHRNRALVVLHGLLATSGQLSNIPTYPPTTHKDAPNGTANRIRYRARSIADIPAKRPRSKGRKRSAGGAERPLGDSDP